MTSAAPLKITNTTTPTPGYKTFTLTNAGNVTRVLINHPPINLLDVDMLMDFNNLLLDFQNNPSAPKVAIFSSADPNFFISHLDLDILSTTHPAPPLSDGQPAANLYVNVTRLLGTVPTILIGEVSGKATAGGNELLVQMDMRFASTGASLGAAEAAVGIIHGAGGLQYLTRLIGPGRAAEYLLSSIDADAKTMADIGWVNRAFDTKEDMEIYVNALSARIGLFPKGGLVGTKRSIRNGFGPRPEALAEDLATVNALIATPVAQGLLDEWLVLSEDQSLGKFELDKDADLVELYGIDDRALELS
jgi:enoyl-CoA hydratase/carnithine racemase